MRKGEFNKRQVVKYLLWTFALAYVIQIGASSLYKNSRSIGQLVLAAMMFVPALGALPGPLDSSVRRRTGLLPGFRFSLQRRLLRILGNSRDEQVIRTRDAAARPGL